MGARDTGLLIHGTSAPGLVELYVVFLEDLLLAVTVGEETNQHSPTHQRRKPQLPVFHSNANEVIPIPLVEDQPLLPDAMGSKRQVDPLLVSGSKNIIIGTFWPDDLIVVEHVYDLQHE